MDRFQAAPISAVMMPTLEGYAVEIEIAKASLSQKQELRFSVYNGTTKSGISSMGSSKGFHSLNTSSSAANRLLEQLAKSVSYIALYDVNFQLRAQTQNKPRQYAQLLQTTVWDDIVGLLDEAMIVLLQLSMGNNGDELETQEELLLLLSVVN